MGVALPAATAVVAAEAVVVAPELAVAPSIITISCVGRRASKVSTRLFLLTPQSKPTLARTSLKFFICSPLNIVCTAACSSVSVSCCTTCTFARRVGLLLLCLQSQPLDQQAQTQCQHWPSCSIFSISQFLGLSHLL